MNKTLQWVESDELNGECPKCGSRVSLDSDGNLKVHAKDANRGAGSRKCGGGGKQPTGELRHTLVLAGL